MSNYTGVSCAMYRRPPSSAVTCAEIARTPVGLTTLGDRCTSRLRYLPRNCACSGAQRSSPIELSAGRDWVITGDETLIIGNFRDDYTTARPNPVEKRRPPCRSCRQ
jgi:hypothetical protein